MKYTVVYILLIAMALFSCDKEDVPSPVVLDSLQNEWHYTSFTGAEGPQCFYDKGVKVYTFSTTELTVVDNYLDDDICVRTFKEGGVYAYEVKLIDGMEYLFINDVEQGRIRFVDGDLLIESWFRSEGVEIADAPTFQLEL